MLSVGIPSVCRSTFRPWSVRRSSVRPSVHHPSVPSVPQSVRPFSVGDFSSFFGRSFFLPFFLHFSVNSFGPCSVRPGSVAPGSVRPSREPEADRASRPTEPRDPGRGPDGEPNDGMHIATDCRPSETRAPRRGRRSMVGRWLPGQRLPGQATRLCAYPHMPVPAYAPSRIWPYPHTRICA